MCGIVFSLRQSTRKNPNPQILANLLIANESRGRQATGIWGNGMYKDTKTATAMFGKQDTQAGASRFAVLKQISQHPVVIGHTRQGTTGDNTKANAHPFRYKNTVGCHNGVLSNYDEIATKYNLPKPEVDSQVIFSALVESNYDMARVSEIHGSIAFVMNREETRKKMMYIGGEMQEVDIPSNITYVYRRDNPMFVSKRGGILYGSSMAEPFKAMGMACESLDADTLYIYTDGRLTDMRHIEYTRPVGYSGVNSFGWTNTRGGNSYGSTTGYLGAGVTSYTPKGKASITEEFEEAVNILVTQCLLGINEVTTNLPYCLGYDEKATTLSRYCLLTSSDDSIVCRSPTPTIVLRQFLTKAAMCPGVNTYHLDKLSAGHEALQYIEAIKWIITYAILQLNGADESYPTTEAGKRVATVINDNKGLLMGCLIEEALEEFEYGTDFSTATKHCWKFGFTQFQALLATVQAQ